MTPRLAVPRPRRAAGPCRADRLRLVRISTLTPASPAIAAARLANSRGVSVLPGRGQLARQVAALPRMRPRSTAARAAERLIVHLEGRHRPGRRSRGGGIAGLVASGVELRERSAPPRPPAPGRRVACRGRKRRAPDPFLSRQQTSAVATSQKVAARSPTRLDERQPRRARAGP